MLLLPIFIHATPPCCPFAMPPTYAAGCRAAHRSGGKKKRGIDTPPGGKSNLK